MTLQALKGGQGGGEDKSELARAIEARGRHVRCAPLDDFFGPGGKPIGAVAFRVAVKADEDAAIVAAHRHAVEASKAGGDGAAAARADGDLLGDAKTIEALYRVCMAAEADGAGGWRLRTKPRPDGAGVITYSAFPSPGWMRSNLTTDQLAYLMHGYLEVRAEASPGGRQDLSDETIDALVEACATHAGNDLPELMLAKVSRVQLTHAFVMVSERLQEARRAVETLLAERSATAAAATEPPPPAEDDSAPPSGREENPVREPWGPAR